MVICFSCAAETKRILDELLEGGEYEDRSQVIVAALESLAMLHTEVMKSGALVIGDSRVEQPGNANDAPPGEVRRRRTRSESTRNSRDRSQEHAQVLLPAMFRLEGLDIGAAPPLAAIPSSPWVVGEEVPLTRWTFGQFNKLLPVKASCRALARLIAEKGQGLELEETAHHIAKQAAILGDYFASRDRRLDVSRDSALATAFPSTGDDAAKSRLRFANQFVGSVNKKGQLSGLPACLKLVNWLDAGNRRLSLTEAGWEFALLPNPILDHLHDDNTDRFSEDERAFLLHHIVEHVSAERYAYFALLDLVASGVDSPSEVDKSLTQRVPGVAQENVTEAFLATQRSGAISRMQDLDLLARERHGVRVKYAITPHGAEYLRAIRNGEHSG